MSCTDLAPQQQDRCRRAHLHDGERALVALRYAVGLLLQDLVRLHVVRMVAAEVASKVLQPRLRSASALVDRVQGSGAASETGTG